MATLNVVVGVTGEEIVISDIDFAVVTPKDILVEFENFGGYLPPLEGGEWRFLKEDGLIWIMDSETPLEGLGFKDGDKAVIMRKIYA